ncbi:MAG: hypothetical protein ACTJFN_03890 [Sphingobacterium sp.]
MLTVHVIAFVDSFIRGRYRSCGVSKAHFLARWVFYETPLFRIDKAVSWRADLSHRSLLWHGNLSGMPKSPEQIADLDALILYDIHDTSAYSWFSL